MGNGESGVKPVWVKSFAEKSESGFAYTPISLVKSDLHSHGNERNLCSCSLGKIRTKSKRDQKTTFTFPR